MDKISKRLIIDTDIGIDDAIAMMIALANPDIDVLAITTVNGNIRVEQATKNTCLLLDFLNRDVPVYQGASAPLFGDILPLGDFMGEDGLGNVSTKLPPTSRQISPEHAALALINLAKEASENEPFTLVALGPLTNLALAVRLDPTFAENIQRLVIMGGAVDARGNASAAAEFNFLADPESAAVVFEAGFSDIWVLPWETTLKHLFLWEELDTLTSLDTAKANFFQQITEHLSDFLKNSFGLPGAPMADPLAMAVALEPQLVKSSIHAFVSIETAGKIGRGLMAVDFLGVTQKMPNAHIVTEVDFESVLTLLRDSIEL